VFDELRLTSPWNAAHRNLGLTAIVREMSGRD